MAHIVNIFDTAIKLKLILTNYAVFLLNTPIQVEPDHFLPMWRNADYRVCVDEASHTLKTYAGKHNISMDNLYPNLLSGDFKSLTQEILEEYKAHGAEVVRTIDDDLTDFTKALKQVAKRKIKVDSIIAIVEPQSRLDHLGANLNTLSMAHEIFGRDVNIYLMGKYYMTWLIPSGKTIIHIPDWIKEFPCGILPYSPSPSRTTTTGLKWNLNNQSIQFNGLVSSSNRFSNESIVTFTTDVSVIWTMTTDKEDIYANPCINHNT